MVKVVGLVRRRADLTQAEFRDYWLNRHSKLERESLRKNPVRRIVANFTEANLVGSAPCDGMVEIYYDSMEDLKRQWSNSHDAVMRADEANFCDPSFRVFFITEEVEIGRKPEEEGSRG
jgi:uncharacterized protein (TIGR02118 family)